MTRTYRGSPLAPIERGQEVFVANARYRFFHRTVATVAVAFFVVLAVAAPSGAQQPSQNATVQRTLVVEDAPIYLLPDITRQPLRTAARGTVLEVLSIEEGWVQVRFQDPQFGLRVGYIESRFLERTTEQTPADLSVPRESDAVLAEPAAEASSDTGGPGGAWFHMGFGYGRAACGGCFGSSGGTSGGVVVGGAISPRVLLGVGTTGFYRSELGSSLSIGTVDARLRLYPLPRIAAFVTGGLGIGVVRLASQNEFGTGAIVGAGWDVPVGRSLSMTPFYNRFLMRSSVIDADVDQIGIGFTIR
jgi:hypothetical protein